MADGKREDFTVWAVAGGAAGQAFLAGTVAAGVFHPDGEPGGLAPEGGKLAGFDFALHDFFHLAEFAGSLLQAHAGAEAGGGMAGRAGGIERGDFGAVVDGRFAVGIFPGLIGGDFSIAGQGDDDVADPFAVAGALEAGAGELPLDLGGGLAEADAADAVGLNQTFGGGGCGKGGDKEGGEDGFHGGLAWLGGVGFSGSLIVQGRGCLKSIDQYEFC